MDKNVASKTMSVNFSEDGRKYVFTAEFGLHDLGQGPYFSVTGELKRVGYREPESCGMMHDEVVKYFPEYAKYLKWHLTSTKTGPMHYIANSLYWFDQKNYEYLKSTCVYGAVYSDKMYNLETMEREEVKKWLEDRFESLMDAFITDMKELFN